MPMRLTGNLGMLLLGLWLILTGLIPFLNPSVSGLGLLLQVLAIAASCLNYRCVVSPEHLINHSKLRFHQTNN